MNQKLEEIIDRRWEVAKELYPGIGRENISALVYRLAELFDWVIEQPAERENI